MRALLRHLEGLKVMPHRWDRKKGEVGKRGMGKGEGKKGGVG
jgi:hypothetical protein